jgi:site-specific DNA recombinase
LIAGLMELRTDPVGDVQRDVATKELARIRAGMTRLIEAYQEQLISLDELRTRMPALRQRETILHTQLATLAAEHLDAATYVTLAESLEGVLAKLNELVSVSKDLGASPSRVNWTRRDRQNRGRSDGA